MARKKSKINEDIFLGSGSNLNIKTSKIVSLQESLCLLIRDDESINLDVTITADFDTIPEQHHEVFLNILTSKYYNKVSFGDNPFSKCVPEPKKKWYQFWK